jgi:glutathione synthase/RimK-type ligase-like ATP-grasp enzyme
MPHIAVVTCRELPVPAPDDELLLGALADAGATTAYVAWDDPGFDWSEPDLCVIRSTWDYTSHHDAFLAWADAVPTLWNPPEVVAWNSHKRYLLDLADAGVDVVPTRLVPRGTELDLAVDLAHLVELIVKPAVSVGSFDTYRVGPDHPLTDEIVADLVAIADPGETAVVVVDGEIAHSFLKSPADGDFRVQLQFGATNTSVEPTRDQERLAERAVAAALDATGTADLLYARVDMVDIDGRPHLMELELIEPDLWLREAPGTLGRLTAAIVDRAS